ncbi:MAG: flagellar basal body-associated FliL family protein [Sulfuricella sp.]|nr:flagellar basal body-associated FliL family protein [Sulfuricella sp.]
MKQLLGSLIIAFGLLWGSAQASGGGGGGSEGGNLYSKIGTFTVNLQNISEFLQADVSVKLPNAQLLDSIKLYLPYIKHELILLLSAQDSQQLASVAGKQKLMEETKTAINKALKVNDKDGISDVLFESFVIQQ